MPEQTFVVGQRVFLSEDARRWMKDIGVRPGRVVMIDGTFPVVDFYGMPERIRVAPWNLERAE